MKKLLKNNLWIAGIVLGAAAGYLYWKNIGCVNGACAIKKMELNNNNPIFLIGGDR